MGDRKRRKLYMTGSEPPTKEELAVADYLRFNVPAKDGKFGKMPVQYFIGSKAVDMLMESKWETKKCKKGVTPLFTSRGSCVEYCRRLLAKDLFYRVRKVEKDKDKKKKKDDRESLKEEKGKKGKKEDETKVKKEEEKTEKKEEDGDKKATEKKEKKKKPAKLEEHDDQKFIDGEELYMWIHDPTSLKNKLIGLMLVFGAIGVCMFPLWPMEVRQGVYYLSLCAAGFVGFILVLCLVRFIVFCGVWAASFGKMHFWLLPNLTEDVGFFDSFKPLYMSEYKGPDKGKPLTSGPSVTGLEGEVEESDGEFEMIDKKDASDDDGQEDMGEEMEEEGSVGTGAEDDQETISTEGEYMEDVMGYESKKTI